MDETLTRGAVTLSPALVLPGRLTGASRSVVHEIIGDTDPDVTSRAPSSRAGDLQLIFATPADAAEAYDALSVVGGAWTIAGTADVDGTWKVVGDLGYEPTGDGMRSRIITIGVREVTS